MYFALQMVWINPNPKTQLEAYRLKFKSILIIINMQSFCIALSHECERIHKVKNEFQRESLEVEFIEGVHGKLLSKEEIKQNTSHLANLIAPHNVIGCAMSHIKAWNLAKERNLDMVLICESDVELCPNFQIQLNENLKKLEKQKQFFDVLYVGSMEFDPRTPLPMAWTLYRSLVSLGNPERTHLVDSIWKPDLALATHCYIITRSGYNKLLKHIQFQISTHIDYQMMMLADQVNYLAIFPPLATQETTHAQSTIQESRFPYLINQLLDSPRENRFSKAYVMCCPIASIAGIPINYWTLVVVIIGLIILFLQFCPIYSLALYLVFLVLCSIPNLKNKSKLPLVDLKITAAMFILMMSPSMIRKYWS